MGDKLDLNRELFTVNGRPLRLLSKTVDGQLVLQSAKAKTIVVTDDDGRVDGRDYAVNRESLRIKLRGPRVLPALRNGQSVHCFRYSRRGACLFRATFVGYAVGQVCRVAPETPLAGREILKLGRQHVFEDSTELRSWQARLNANFEAQLGTGGAP